MGSDPGNCSEVGSFSSSRQPGNCSGVSGHFLAVSGERLAFGRQLSAASCKLRPVSSERWQAQGRPVQVAKDWVSGVGLGSI